MDIWKIEKPFDYKIFLINFVCYLVIRHSGNYCTQEVENLNLNGTVSREVLSLKT